MAKIKVTSKCAIYDGMTITFRAPCDCSEVDGLNVYYLDEVQAYSFRDTNGNDLAGIDALFSEGAYVTAALDPKMGYAYLLNADTNLYLESVMASTATYTASVGTTWKSNSSGGYYQTVAVPGILASDNPIADVVLGDTPATNELYLTAWSSITRITTAADSITLYASAATTTSITVQLKVVR